MTLEEYIKMNDVEIKLGTKGGGFVYCGNVKNIDFAKLDINNILRKVDYISECQKIMRRRNNDLIRPKASYERYCVNCIGTPILYEFWKKQLVHEIEVKKAGINRECNNLAHYKRIQEREVIETYPSIAENACIVIIEGDEIGDYWSPDEYERSDK